MKREHGKHNREVCDILYFQSNVQCSDWVITTAFYSSIHYLDHLLFPFNYQEGVVFNNINEAHRIVKQPNKHETRGILVSKKLPSFAGDYTFLKEECYNARYSNFNVNKALADRAVRIIDKIISESDKIYNSEKKR